MALTSRARRVVRSIQSPIPSNSAVLQDPNVTVAAVSPGYTNGDQNTHRSRYMISRCGRNSRTRLQAAGVLVSRSDVELVRLSSILVSGLEFRPSEFRPLSNPGIPCHEEIPTLRILTVRQLP